MTDSHAPQGADTGLLHLVATGDESAFEELVEKYRHSVINTIHRYVGEYDAADDIAQEVFVIVWTKAGTFKGKSSFSTWLYRIVVNECLQFRRTRKRKPPPVSLDSMDADSPPESLQTGDGHEQAARTAAVRQAIAELPDRQRIAIVLSHYEGLTYVEVAAALETSVPAVESLLIRARSALRDKLVEHRQRPQVSPVAGI